MAEHINFDELGDDDFEDAQAEHDETLEGEQLVTETMPEQVEEPTAEADTEEEPEEVIEETEEPIEDEIEAEEGDDTPESEIEEEDGDEESQESDQEEVAEDDSETAELDYKDAYDSVLQPIKVSGEDVQVKSVSDLRTLASMGIDYSRKMRDIKPLRALGQTLEKAGLMSDGNIDEQALLRLIDIKNGNRDALSDLMKEQDIDPFELEMDDFTYETESTMVDESSVAFSDIEKELVSRGSINKVVEAINKFDAESKAFFNDEPSNLLGLEEDIASGAYAQIISQVHYEKSVGRMTDLSDMEAYIEIASGGKSNNENSLAQEQEVTPVQKPRVNSSKRKAAGIAKKAPVSKQKKTYDYAAMSDEEFEALVPSSSMY